MSYSYVDDYLRSLPQTLSSTLSSGGGGVCNGRVSDADLDEIIAGLLRPPGGPVGSTRSGSTSSSHTTQFPAAATASSNTTATNTKTSAASRPTSKYDSDTYYSSLLDVDGFISSLEGGHDVPPSKKEVNSPNPTASMSTERGGLSTSRTPTSAASVDRDATSSSHPAGTRSSGSPQVVMHNSPSGDYVGNRTQSSSHGGNTDLRVPPTKKEDSPNPSRSVRFHLDSTPEPPSHQHHATTTSPVVPDPSTPDYVAAMGATSRGLWTSSPTAPTSHHSTTPPQPRGTTTSDSQHHHQHVSSGPVSPQPYAEEISRDEEVYHSRRKAAARQQQQPLAGAGAATPSPQHRRGGGLRVSPTTSRTEVRSSLFFGEDDDEVVGNNNNTNAGHQMDWNTMFTPERYDYLQRRRWGLAGSGDDTSIERVDLGAGDGVTLDEDVSELVNVLDAALSRSLARQESVVEKESNQMAALTRFTSAALRNITARVDPTLCTLLDSNELVPEVLHDDEEYDDCLDGDVSDTTSTTSSSDGGMNLGSNSQIDDPHTPRQPGSSDGAVFPQNDCSTPIQPTESMPGWWELTELITRRLLEAPSSLEETTTSDPSSSSKAAIESARVAFQGVLHTLVRKEEFLVAATPQVGRTTSATPRRGAAACATTFASPWGGGRRSTEDTTNNTTPIAASPRGGDKSLVRLCKSERIAEVQQALSAIAASLTADAGANNNGGGGGVELGYGDGSEGPRLAFLRLQQATLANQLEEQRQTAKDALHLNAGAAKAQYDTMRTFLATNDAQLADLVAQKEALEGRIEIALHSRRSHMVQFVEDIKSAGRGDYSSQNNNSNNLTAQYDANIAALKRQYRLAAKETEREAAHAALMATLEREVRVPLSTIQIIHPSSNDDMAPTPDYAAYYQPEMDPMGESSTNNVPDVDWDAVVPDNAEEGHEGEDDGNSLHLHHQPTAIFNTTHADPEEEPHRHWTTTNVSMGALFAGNGEDDGTDDYDDDSPLEGRF